MAKPVAVVTGAGSGIGRLISRELLDSGYRVALFGRRYESLKEASGNHEESLIVVGNVAISADVARLFDAVKQIWTRIDLLVNNAGISGPTGDVSEIEVSDWQQTIDVNLTGTFLCASYAFQAMKDQLPQGGRIINNGSISAHVPRPRNVAYTASKHAVSGLSKAIALDGRPYKIACGQIDIGNAATDLTTRYAVSAVQADGSTRPEPTFEPIHVAKTVVAMAELPLEVNVQSLTIVATAMPYVGRG